jgi:hypothetical protein
MIRFGATGRGAAAGNASLALVKISLNWLSCEQSTLLLTVQASSWN